MSAVGGILSLHSLRTRLGTRPGTRPVARGGFVADRLSRGLAQIGPDSETWHHESRLSVVFRALHVDADSRFAQPRVENDGLVVVFNGRLDNARELRRELCREIDGADSTAAQLVAACYRRHGDDSVARLIGDFSLAIWEPGRRKLLLATDPFALRPLFFHHGAEHFAFASRARALVDALGLSHDLDDVGVAAFLTFIDAGSRTVLRDVQMLPAAHLLTVEDGVVRMRRYWHPADAAPIRYACDTDYEEHFAQVFRRAVADRLVADAPVWADLSGGLDSSSIVCVADRAMAEEHGSRSTSQLASRLETVSYVYGRNASCDEREYIRSVEQQRGRRGLYISDDEVPTLAPIPSSLRPDLPSGQLPFHNRYEFQRRAMAHLGSRVLLRGSGGDHVLWGEAPAAFELADLFARRRPAAAVRRARVWARQRREPLVKTLWQGGVWPLLPRGLRAATGFAHRVDGWFDADFVRRVDLPGRLLGEDDRSFAQPSQRIQWSWIAGVGRYVGWELPLEHGCVESRYPFLDRRLVELAMAMPTEQKLRPGETRSILRRALRGVLPEAVRTRTSKSGPDEAVYRGFTRESRWLAALFDDARVCRHGLVQAEALRRSLAAARHGAMLNSPQLLRTLSLEFWLRSLDGTNPDVSQAQPSFERGPRGPAPIPSMPEPPSSSLETPQTPSRAPGPSPAPTAALRGTEVNHEALHHS